ncbi:MAG: PAS domain S-box protein [Verrucomicrobia bacterium]|nr:PAS domain S-box protein [Verrucomicrobiota bacterium]
MSNPSGPEDASPLPPAAEEHFGEIVAGIEDYAIFLLDARGYVASWNAGAERLKGYKAEDILGKHFSLFYPPEPLERGWPEYELKTAAQTGHFNDEGWRLRKDGSRFWANVTITALKSPTGALRGFLKITRDLTERKQAEEALRQSEERFRMLVEGVQDYAIFMLDPEGYVISWNRGAERLKGYQRHEILGKHFSIFYPPETLEAGKPAWELRQALEHGCVEDEGWRVRKDGGRFWANVVITAIHDKEHVLQGFTKVTRDLTERRKIEMLEEMDRQKNEFLAVLAHELRNPLAPIRNAMHILEAPGADAATLGRARVMTRRQIEHMARLLDDLVDLARLNRGRFGLRKEQLDLETVVDHAVEAARLDCEERQQQLSVSLPAQPVRVFGDRTRLEQALGNLLNNAAKYTNPGGRIWVRLTSTEAEATVRVQDSGIGIEPMMLPRIFNLFVQADRRLDRSVGGLGIGLSLVKQLIELHGGKVDAFSPGRGKGSEFVVRLPVAPNPQTPQTPEAPDAAAEQTARASGPAQLRVLVVDDNVDAADALAAVVHLAGHAAQVAYEGSTALALAPQFKPHLVLLDIGLPGMDGHAVGRALRQRPETKDTVLVAVTGWGQAEDRRKSQEAGFARHLVKPVDPAVLKTVLAELTPSAAGEG